MKKLIFLLLFGILFIAVNAQKVRLYDSIPFPAVQDDTVVYIPMYDNYNWGLEVWYDDLDDVDGELDLAGVQLADGAIFNGIDDARLPYVMADSTESFEKSNFSFMFLAMKFTPNTCTKLGSGDYPIKFRLTRR